MCCTPHDVTIYQTSLNINECISYMSFLSKDNFVIYTMEYVIKYCAIQ